MNDGSAVDGEVNSGSESFVSNLVNLAGKSFNIQFDAVAGSGVMDTVSTDLGVMSTGADSLQWDVNTDAVTFSNLSIQNFDPMASGLSVGDISVNGFQFMSFSAASASTDQGSIDGVVWTDVGSTNQTFPLTSSTTVTHVQNLWRLDSIGIDVSAVPEPSSFIFGGGLAMLLIGHRRRGVS